MAFVKRFALMVFLIWCTVTATFFLIRLIPGNPVEMQVLALVKTGIPYALAVKKVSVMYDINVSQPLMVQYLNYIGGLFHGDLGQSVLFPNASITQLIGETLPWTVFTVGASLVISFVFGVVLGTVMAYRRGGWLDKIMTPIASVLQGVPNYLVATIMLFVFAVVLRWFPSQGAYSPNVTVGFNLPFIASVLRHAVLPISAYVFTSFAGWLLLMQSNTVSVLGQDFIAGARSHGIGEGRIMLRYVAPNSILPMVTNFVLSIALMFGGSVLVESIFTYPGIGFLFAQATANSDYDLLQALFGVLTICIIVANFVADILYTRLDPRITMEDIV
jgi:peptide/nickel transport system permease protein